MKGADDEQQRPKRDEKKKDTRGRCGRMVCTRADVVACMSPEREEILSANLTG